MTLLITWSDGSKAAYWTDKMNLFHCTKRAGSDSEEKLFWKRRGKKSASTLDAQKPEAFPFTHADVKAAGRWYRNALWEFSAPIGGWAPSFFHCIRAGFWATRSLHLSDWTCVFVFVFEEPELGGGGGEESAALLWGSDRLAAAHPPSLRQHLRLRQQGAAQSHTTAAVSTVWT